MKFTATDLKIGLVTGALVLGFTALGYRLVDLQVVRHHDLQERAEHNTHRTISRPPMRGQILDIRGNPLATSIPAKIICADPSLLGDRRAQVARALAPLLQTNENFVFERLAPRLREDGKTNGYIVLKRKVTLDAWEAIKKTMSTITFGIDETKLKPLDKRFYTNLRAKAVFAEDDEIRVYPNGRLASHVLGYVANDDLQSGQNGVELAFNSKLTGVRGWLRTEIDKRQRELVVFREEAVDPRDGLNVVLTIDAGLQNIAENELVEIMKKHTPISASCTIVRPRTGEILAMATIPNFDPNRPGAFPMDALRNRIISDIAEPGSTFKIVVISAGLNEQVVHLSDVFNCGHGQFPFAGKVLHDHEPYDDLTVVGIITKSSNIGSAKVGIRLGEQRLYKYITDYGFGTKTGIPLPGEVSGIVHPIEKWSKVSIAQIPMGQGIAVTPLQMVMAMSAIANHGVLMRPMLVDRLENSDGKIVAKYQPQPVRTVATDRAIKDMITALKTVPTKDGTAEKAHMEHFTVAGKTGTAQKVEHGHYAPGKYFSSFIGFFPADNPEIVISIVLDEPKNGHYGGLTAAPYFKEMADRAANYLNLKPDIEVEPLMDGQPRLLQASNTKKGQQLKQH
ncbi:MAG: ftsI [Verrucomicrobiales bacterium]|nr:ftsI [Verrucomicrobiales bacterium]